MNQAVPKTRWWRIVGVAFLLYTIAFMDRNNMGFGFSGFEKDLGISATYAGLAGSIFFIGYFLLQMPGGVLAEKWSTKKLVLICILVWGVFAILTGLVQNLTQLLIVRFLLGFAEGAVYPAIVVLITKWFPASERGRALSYFILCIPFGSMVMSPLSGYLMALFSWRMMFIIEGIVPFVWALVWWLLIDDEPKKAKWLSKAELEYLESEFAKEKQEKTSNVVNYKQAFKNRNIILLVFIYFFIQVGQYGIGLWLPTVIKSLSGGNPVLVGWLTAIPWAAGILGLIINGNHSDKTKERRIHVVVALTVGGTFLFISTLIGSSNAFAAIATLVLAVGFFQAYNGIIWAIPAEIVDLKMVGPITGLINGVGTLGGGFVGPLGVGYIIQHSSVLAGEIFLVVSLFIASALLLSLKYNKKPNVQQINSENFAK